MLFNKLKKSTPNSNNNSNSNNNQNSPIKNTSINNSEEKKESSGINGVVNNLFNRKTIPIGHQQQGQQQGQQGQSQLPQQPKPTILSQTTDVSTILNFQPLTEQYKHNFIDAFDFIKNEQLLIDNLNLINNSPTTSPNLSSINGVSMLTATINNNSNNNNNNNPNNNNNNLTSLIIDPKIIGLMNLFIDTTFLKQNGIDKIYELKPGKLETESKNIIYLIRPRVKYMHFITEHIKNHLFDYVKKNYSIIYIPKIDPICDSILEEQGVYGSFSTITSMSLDLIPFDNDVLSMELSSSYREYLLENNKSICFDIAKSIMKLQSLFGLIPILKGKGKASKLVVEILNRLRIEKQQQQKDSQINNNNNNNNNNGGSGNEEADNNGNQTSSSSSSTFKSLEISKEIESLILIDRDLDLITPLCTPLTYEGLIDEYFSINNNILLVDSQILTDSIGSVSGKPGQTATPHGSMYYNKKSSFPLHSGDKIYCQVRDMNFSSLIGPGGVLNAKAKQQYLEDKKLTGSESLTAIRDLMKRINSNKQEEFCLQVHVGIAEKIHEITTSTYFQNRLDCEQKLLLGSDDIYLAEKYIQDCIAIKDPILKILRLLCLYSLTSNGLALGDYESIKTKIINSYGMDWLIQLSVLEKVGLIQIRKSDSKPIGNWPLVKEDLNLIVDDVSETNPTDFSYVYSGYAPLLIRLIQYSLPGSRIGWKSIENVLKLLPGPIFDENQSFFLNNNSNNINNNNNNNNTNSNNNNGGISHSNSYPSNINNLNNNNNNNNVASLPNSTPTTLNNNNSNSSNIINNFSEKPIVSLVFFVGGVTFSEISALRFLGKQTNRKFIILTTKLINGDSLVQSFLDQIG